MVLIGNEVHQIKMGHTIAMLKQWIEREEHARVVVGDFFKVSVLAVLGGAIRDAHGHLNVVVLVKISARDKVALELANFAHAQGITVAAEVLVGQIFECRAKTRSRKTLFCCGMPEAMSSSATEVA